MTTEPVSVAKPPACHMDRTLSEKENGEGREKGEKISVRGIQGKK